jgi:hypothetical protein
MRRFWNYSVFYGVWIAMIVGETYLWAILGFALGYIVFVVGGLGLAYYHHRKTLDGEKPFGWPLRIAKSISEHYAMRGLLVNTLLNGAPGVSIVETSLGRNWLIIRYRVLLAAFGYATLWFLIHYFRPPSVIPIYWLPSLAAF